MSDFAKRSEPRLLADHVIVLGAGLSGLTAAYQLQSKGLRVTLLERGHRPGGRATHERKDGLIVGAAVPWVSTRDWHLLSLIEELGLSQHMLPLKPMTLAQLRHGAVETIVPTGTRGVRSIPGVAWHEGWRVARLGRFLRQFEEILTPERPTAALRLDDRSIADHVRTYFGSSVLERWVEPMMAADGGGADVEETSRALFLLHQVHRAYAPEGALRGGIGRLTEALAQRCQVEVENEVVSVETTASGFRVFVRRGHQTQTLEADAVISTLPAQTARTVLDPVLSAAERDILAAGRSAPAIVASIGVQGELERKATRIRLPRVEGLAAVSVVIEPVVEEHATHAETSLATVVAGADWSQAHLQAADEVVEKAMIDVVENLYGALDLRFVTLRRYRSAFPCFDVGRFRALAQLQKIETDRARHGRRLFHAGDQLVAPTLEGAVIAGKQAAERTLLSLEIEN